MDAAAELPTTEGDSDDEQTLVVEGVPEVRGGLYTDLALVTHDQDAVTIDFMASQPGSDDAVVLQARMRMSHRMAMRLTAALQANLAKLFPKEIEAREQEATLFSDLLEALGQGHLAEQDRGEDDGEA